LPARLSAEVELEEEDSEDEAWDLDDELDEDEDEEGEGDSFEAQSDDERMGVRARDDFPYRDAAYWEKPMQDLSESEGEDNY
jgi:hypothetical protein